MTKAQRNRPKISQTIAAETLDNLRQIGEQQRLPNIGVVIDYVTHDWQRMREALAAGRMVLSDQPHAVITEQYIAIHPETEVR